MASEELDIDIGGQGSLRALKDLGAGAAGGMAQVLLGMKLSNADAISASAFLYEASIKFENQITNDCFDRSTIRYVLDYGFLSRAHKY